MQLTKSDINVILDEVTENIRTGLNGKNIATNFIKIVAGQNSSTSTTTTNVATIFKSWRSFGDGNWGYNSSSNWIYNTKNSSYMTGYYDASGKYENIELEFDAMTTDGDDDMIGSMIRFNALGSSKYSTYVLLLDRHDSSGGGIGNGSYNGISKVVNNTFTNHSTLQTLSVNPSNVWKRNTWQKYKFIAKGTKISAYLDGKLIAEATDNSISSGTVGFVSYSQANTYFRNITIKTTKVRALGEIIKNVNWDSAEKNIIVNISNDKDDDLSEEEVINIMNNNEIYYFALGNTNNKDQIEAFLQNVNNRGMYLESSDVNTSINEVVEYLANKLKQ